MIHANTFLFLFTTSVFLGGFVFALINAFLDPKPQTTPSVISQIALIVACVGIVGLQIAAVRRDLKGFYPLVMP